MPLSEPVCRFYSGALLSDVLVSAAAALWRSFAFNCRRVLVADYENSARPKDAGVGVTSTQLRAVIAAPSRCSPPTPCWSSRRRATVV
jgi:hypothetical protein